MVPSWLGKGTSFRSRLATPYPPWGWTALAALFREDEEKAATAAARKGTICVAGLAVYRIASHGTRQPTKLIPKASIEIPTHPGEPARPLSSRRRALLNGVARL